MSSSWKKVDVISRDYFDSLNVDGRPRSTSEFFVMDIEQTSEESTKLSEITNQLSPSAPPFRPRSMTAPVEQLSRSLPTNVPCSPSPTKRPKGSRTPKYLKDNQIAPRFYPAISKENVPDDGLVSSCGIMCLKFMLCAQNDLAASHLHCFLRKFYS